MNFNKIGLVALSTAAIFMATSCNKSQTLKLEDAKAWVDKHYEKGLANPLSGTVKYDFSATSGADLRIHVRKLFEEFSIDLNEDMKKDYVMSKQELQEIKYLESTDWIFKKEEFEDLPLPTYVVSNNAMTIKYDSKKVGLDAKVVAAHNTKGAPTKLVHTIKNVKVESYEGVVNGSVVTTYTY